MFVKKGWLQLLSLAVILSPVLFVTSCGGPGAIQAPAPTQTDKPVVNGNYSASDLQEIQVTLESGRKLSCLIGTYKLWCTSQ